MPDRSSSTSMEVGTLSALGSSARAASTTCRPATAPLTVMSGARNEHGQPIGEQVADDGGVLCGYDEVCKEGIAAHHEREPGHLDALCKREDIIGKVRRRDGDARRRARDVPEVGQVHDPLVLQQVGDGLHVAGIAHRQRLLQRDQIRQRVERVAHQVGRDADGRLRQQAEPAVDHMNPLVVRDDAEGGAGRFFIYIFRRQLALQVQPVIAAVRILHDAHVEADASANAAEVCSVTVSSPAPPATV